MKNLAIILSILFFCGQTVLADDITVNANQEINIEDNKAVVSIQKQPVDEKSTQKQAVKNNWFCIVVQVNGKVKDSNFADK